MPRAVLETKLVDPALTRIESRRPSDRWRFPRGFYATSDRARALFATTSFAGRVAFGRFRQAREARGAKRPARSQTAGHGVG